MNQLVIQYLVALTIFIYGLILFTFGLGNTEIIGFESRFYLFILEMWRNGPGWFVTTYDQPYPDYPVTAFYLIYLFSKWLGVLNKFVAVLPSAFISALTLALTYLIGAKRNPAWGFSAVCFLLMTMTFVTEARTISLDQYITFITVLCFYSALLNKKWVIFFLFILGFSIRGPIGLIIPASVIGMYFLMNKDFKALFMLILGAAVLMVLCGITLIIFAYAEGGMQFVNEVLKMQVIGRIRDVSAPSWNFYFIESIGAYAIAYPLALLVAVGFGKIKIEDRHFVLLLLVWILIILLGLSIPADKKVRYILPMVPALALLCGYIYTEHRPYSYFYFLQQFFYCISLIFPLLSIVLLIALFKIHPEFDLNYKLASIFFIVMQLILVFLHFNHMHKKLIALFLMSFNIAVIVIFFVEPINLQANQTRQFVQTVEALRIKDNAQLIFYREGLDGLVIKYLVNMPKFQKPIFIQEANTLLKLNKSAIYITSEENFRQIPDSISAQFKLILTGKIGREPFLVLKLSEN